MEALCSNRIVMLGLHPSRLRLGQVTVVALLMMLVVVVVVVVEEMALLPRHRFPLARRWITARRRRHRTGSITSNSLLGLHLLCRHPLLRQSQSSHTVLLCRN